MYGGYAAAPNVRTVLLQAPGTSDLSGALRMHRKAPDPTHAPGMPAASASSPATCPSSPGTPAPAVADAPMLAKGAVGSGGAAGPGGAAVTLHLPKMWAGGGKAKPFARPVEQGSAEWSSVCGYFYSCGGQHIPGVKVLAVERNENFAKYTEYCTHREFGAGAHVKGGNERWLWHGSTSVGEIVQAGKGMLVAFASQTFNVYGVGNYFAPDVRLSDFFLGPPGHRVLLLCRVAVGRCAEKAPVLPQGSPPAQWTAELIKAEHKKAPDGYDSCTSKHRTEVIVYQDSHAYPAYVVRYKSSGSAGHPYQDKKLKASLKRIDLKDPANCKVQWKSDAGKGATGGKSAGGADHFAGKLVSWLAPGASVAFADARPGLKFHMVPPGGDSPVAGEVVHRHASHADVQWAAGSKAQGKVPQAWWESGGGAKGAHKTGYGFIGVGGGEVFVHESEFAHCGGPPKTGSWLAFARAPGKSPGQTMAKDVTTYVGTITEWGPKFGWVTGFAASDAGAGGGGGGKWFAPVAQLAGGAAKVGDVARFVPKPPNWEGQSDVATAIRICST